MTDTRTSTERPELAGARATIREIRQQPEVWREAASLLAARRSEIDAFLAPLRRHPGLRVVLTGAGTSAFVGGVAAPALARLAGGRFEAVATTDLVSNPREYLAEDIPTLLVSFARSGNSPESVAATRLADTVLSDVRHLVLTCNAEGELLKEHEGREDSLVLAMPGRSNDEGFAMTSSFTTMLLAALLVFAGDDARTVDALAAAGESVLGQWDDVAALAGGDYRRIVYLGSGPLGALAQEAALKLLELTAGAVVSFHDSPLGFRHGPKSVLDDETLALLFVSTDDYTRRYDLDMHRELQEAIGADRVLAVAASGVADGTVVTVPGVEGLDDAYLGVAYMVVAQILALSFALKVGTTADNPFPTGAVNRVVQGVRIHPLPAVRPRA